MQYLGTNEVGCDAVAIGFPSVKTCQAIIYQTGQYLFGFHDAFTTDARFLQKCNLFAQYVQERSQSHKFFARAIIGVINSTQRFGMDSEAPWRTQLENVAAALSFQGEIWGARIVEWIDPDDSLYIRFDAEECARPGPSHCKVRYRTWARMDFAAARPNNDQMRKQLRTDPAADPLPSGERLLMVGVAAEDDRPVIRSGRTSDGSLHEVTDFSQFRG